MNAGEYSAFDGLAEGLRRARERVLKGEPWDAAEIYQPKMEFMSEIAAQNADGDSVIFVNQFEMRGGERIVTDDPAAPKLSKLMWGANIPSVMDSRSAEKTLKKIGEQLQGLWDMKHEFAAVLGEIRADSLVSGAASAMELDVPVQSRLKNEEADEAGMADKTISHTKRESAVTEERAAASVGIMTYFDGDKTNPVLTRPNGAIGNLFAKLTKFFSDKIGNFSGLVLDFSKRGMMNAEAKVFMAPNLIT